MGRDYLACSAARKLGTCRQRTSIRRAVLEEAVLQLLKDRVMQPEGVAQFIKAVGNETNARNGTASARTAQLQSERAAVARNFRVVIGRDQISLPRQRSDRRPRRSHFVISPSPPPNPSSPLPLPNVDMAMVGLAQGGTAKSPLVSGLDASSVLVVAGAGFEPATFRL